MIPKTEYARTADGARIAYQILGNGSRDLVYVPELISHLDHAWSNPSFAELLRRLSTFSA